MLIYNNNGVIAMKAIKTMVILSPYEKTGISLLMEKQGSLNKSEIIRQAIRNYLKNEGVNSEEIQANMT